jgi:hypothetical protein
MPGLNQRGPDNQGPMTGRGQGVCRRQSAAGRWFDGGTRQGLGRGNSRQRAGRGSMGLGNRFGQPEQAGAESHASMQDQIDLLERELAAVRQELRNTNK